MTHIGVGPSGKEITHIVLTNLLLNIITDPFPFLKLMPIRVQKWISENLHVNTKPIVSSQIYYIYL